MLCRVAMGAVRLITLLTIAISAISAQEGSCPPRNLSISCAARECAPDQPCRKAAKECICDGECGWSCLNRGCPMIAAPENGVVEIIPQSREVGSNASFICDYGYVLNGVDNLLCLENKTWNASPGDTSCECRRDPTKVYYQGRQCLRPCASGDECAITRGRTCVCDDVCGLSCIRTDMDDFCDKTELVSENVNTTLVPSTAVFRTVATQTCMEGHEPADGLPSLVERRCVGSGDWTGQNLICLPINRCRGPLPNVTNAEHSDSRPYFLPGYTVNYQCKTGYSSNRRISVTCLDSYEWGSVDEECLPLNCGTPDDIDNGHFLGRVYTFRSIVTYYCDDGYRLVGLAERHCASDREWTGVAPSCDDIACDKPSPPENGAVEWRNGDIIYSCSTGFGLEGLSTRTCRQESSWSGAPPICRVRDCGDPGDISNGTPSGSGTTYNSIFTYACDDGYRLKGSKSIQCQANGQWSESVPICKPTFCNIEAFPTTAPKQRVRGEPKTSVQLILPSDQPTTAHNDTLTVECEVGFWLNSPNIFCRDGKWETRRLQCMIYRKNSSS